MAIVDLGHQHLLVGVGRNLSQVGHHEDLSIGGQRGQRLPDPVRRLAPHAGIHLIEQLDRW